MVIVVSTNRKQTSLGGELGCFVRKYGRKAHAGRDPSDRWYDKEVEKAMRRLRPEELCDLLSGDGEADATDIGGHDGDDGQHSRD